MNRARMGHIALSAMMLLIGGTLLANAEPDLTSSTDNKEAGHDHPKIQSMVENLFTESDDRAFARTLAGNETAQLFATDIQGNRARVVVEAASEAAASTLVERIDEAGGRVETTYGSSIQAYLSEPTLRELADTNLVSFVRMPVRPRQLTSTKQPHQATDSRGSVVSEGLDVIGSRPWNEAGLNGEGVKIGISDLGFQGYRQLFGEEFPPRDQVEARSFHEDTDIECSDCSETNQLHGTGVGEIVHDVAPNASLYLSNFGTLVEAQNAIDWMLEQNVDVINSSWGFWSGCFQKGAGILEPQIAEARRQGVTWVTSSGNDAGLHWQGTWQDRDRDGQHDFETSDEALSFDVELVEDEEDGQRVAAADFFVILSWDGNCGNARDAYDLKLTVDELHRTERGDWLWEPGIPIKIAGRSLRLDRTSLIGEEVTVDIAIEAASATAQPAKLDLLIVECRRCTGGDFDRLKPKGSVSITEPSISRNAMTVGAVHHAPGECGDLCSDGSLLFYSSRGPTKDGRIKPDIAAPTHVSTTAFGEWTGEGEDEDSGFTGTSAASPHAAGAAALVTQAKPDFSPDEVQEFLEDRAEDVGPPGKDNRYGAGTLTLGPLPTDRQPPRLRVAPSELSFTATVGQPSGPSRSLQIRNAGGSTLNWSAQTTASWLRLSRTSGTAPATVEVSPRIQGLSAGTHQARIVVTAAGAGVKGSPATVAVELTLQAEAGAPKLKVLPDRLTFEATVGKGNPPAQPLAIRNAGEGTLEWQATSTARWIQLSAKDGTAPSDVEVTVNPGGLSEGQHQGRIVIRAADADNSPVPVPVILNVSKPDPVLEVTPKRLEFQATVGQQDPPSQTVTIQNAGGGTLDWQAEANVDWLQLEPTEGTAPSEMAVVTQLDDLSAGTYQATITVSTANPEDGVEPATVDVTLTLEEAPAQPKLEVLPDPPNLDFGTLKPEIQETLKLTIRNAGGGTLAWKASINAAWATTAPSSGQLDAGQEQAVQVTVDTATLAPGEHTSTLRVSAETNQQSTTGTIRVRIADQKVEGQLLALVFKEFVLNQPKDWTRSLQDGCLRYTNASDSSSTVRVLLLNDSARTFEVPAGNQLIVCGRVIHIDTRN